MKVRTRPYRIPIDSANELLSRYPGAKVGSALTVLLRETSGAEELKKEIMEYIRDMEKRLKKAFGEF